MTSLVSQIRVIDVTAADEIFAGLEGDNFYSFVRRLRAGVRITLAWPCTCPDRTPRMSTLDSPVQHCCPCGSWCGASLAVIRAAYDGPVSGRTRPLWSHSSFNECLRQAKIREITSCAFVLIIPRFEDAEKHGLRRANGKSCAGRCDAIRLISIALVLGSCKSGTLRAVVASRMSDSITTEQEFCSRDVTGDTQHARARLGRPDFRLAIGNATWWTRGFVTTASDTSGYVAHGAFLEHSSSWSGTCSNTAFIIFS
jgi:hypothetical protein